MFLRVAYKDGFSHVYSNVLNVEVGDGWILFDTPASCDEENPFMIRLENVVRFTVLEEE